MLEFSVEKVRVRVAHLRGPIRIYPLYHRAPAIAAVQDERLRQNDTVNEE